MVEIIGGFTPSNMNSWSMKNIPRWKEKTSSTPPQWLWGYMFMFGNRRCTLPETNSSPLKMDGSNTTFLLERPVFRFHVNFQGCIQSIFGNCRVDHWMFTPRCAVWSVKVWRHPNLWSQWSCRVANYFGKNHPYTITPTDELQTTCHPRKEVLKVVRPNPSCFLGSVAPLWETCPGQRVPAFHVWRSTAWFLRVWILWLFGAIIPI